MEQTGKREPLNEEEQQITDRMSVILRQFKDARKYVIAMPLHNFNVPSKLKDYIDNILIARETFRYTKNGSEGLLTDGRRLLVIQASDAIYTNNDWYTEVEYSHKYLKSMFNFMGIMDYQIIRAQGMPFWIEVKFWRRPFRKPKQLRRPWRLRRLRRKSRCEVD